MTKMELIKSLELMSNVCDGKKLSTGMLDFWFDDLKFYSQELFDKALKALLKHHKGSSLPTLASVLEAVRNQKIAAEHAKATPSWQEVVSRSGKDSPYVIECKQILKDACSGKLTEFNLADAMWAMESRWPGKGWEEEAREVFWNANEKHGTQQVEVLRPISKGGGKTFAQERPRYKD